MLAVLCLQFSDELPTNQKLHDVSFTKFAVSIYKARRNAVSQSDLRSFLSDHFRTPV